MTRNDPTDNARRHRLEGAELLLIRIGQHLFKEWRTKGRSDKALEETLECVWGLKREVREEKRKLLDKMRQRTISEATGPSRRGVEVRTGHSHGRLFGQQHKTRRASNRGTLR